MSSGCGRLTLVVGSMFASKTEEVIRWARRAERARLGVVVLRPMRDDRSEAVETHAGDRYEGRVLTVDTASDARPFIGADVDLIALDEVQFFHPTSTLSWVHHWISAGCDVIAAGLDLDFRGHPFETTANLLALADDVLKRTAVCVRCSGEARRTFRTAPGTERIQTGGAEAYTALCVSCFHAAR